MRHPVRWIALALSLAVLPAALRADDKVEGDLKKMQGSWVKASDEGPEITWKVEGTTLKASVNGMDYTCSVKLDEKATPNATADLEIKEGPGDTTGKIAKAIYKFDGEKLVICISHPGNDRPGEFKYVEDQTVLLLLKKE
ncbi:MAG: TIGR03067 domain-containing protein [Isosphaeraceae bacterium]